MEIQKAKNQLRRLQKQISKAIKHDSWKSVEHLVTGSENFNLSERIEVYHQAYWARLEHALEGDFPGLKKVLKSELFEKIVRDFLSEHPSRHPSMTHLVKDFVHYVLKKRSLSQLAHEMARFEGLLVESFFAKTGANSMVKDLRRYQNRGLSKLYLAVDPAFRLGRFDWPVNKILKRQRLVRRRRTHVMIYRIDGVVYWLEIKPAEYACLKQLVDQATLAQISKKAAQQGLTAKKAQLMTQEWSALKIVIGLKPSRPLSTSV